MKRCSKGPDYYTFVPVHMCFDVKFDLWTEEKLVAGGNMTVESEKGEYCGVVNIENLRTALLLGKFNGLEVAAVDFGNAYLHIFTNKNIYAVAGPEFGE